MSGIPPARLSRPLIPRRATQLARRVTLSSALLLAGALHSLQAQVLLIRGDPVADGEIDLADPVGILFHLFVGGEALPCLSAADADDDGHVDTRDAVQLLRFLFLTGQPPAPPYPDCGEDPTPEGLDCDGHAPCKPPNVGPEITEWPVPWSGTRPRDPYVDSQGRVWFVGQRGDYVAYLDVESGEFSSRFRLRPGAGPHNLIVGDDFVWYAGNGDAHIGRLDPESGDITILPMPNAAARDPHTLIFDAQGDIWFTVQNGNFVGKLSTLSGEIDLIPVPTSRARPYGIDLDSTGTPWVAEFGTNKLGRVDPQALEITEFPLPRSAARPRRLQVTSDDRVWYVDYTQGYLGRLDPPTGDIKEWRVPSGDGARPYGMAVDDLDRLWFVETGPSPNRFVGFDPTTEEFFGSTPIESGGGTVRHMYFHAPTRAIWFGADTNTIGRAQL